MPTQLEHLRRTLANLEAEGVSKDNPFRQGIEAQIALHERRLWREANGGWWGENSKFLQMPCGGPERTGMTVPVTKSKGKTQ